jgi:hypothetical protein
MRWVEQIACTGAMISTRLWSKRNLKGTSRHAWEVNHFRYGVRVWTYLAQWWALVNMVMNLWVALGAGNFLRSRVTIRRTLLLGGG